MYKSNIPIEWTLIHVTLFHFENIEQGSANYSPGPICVNKVLLEHNKFIYNGRVEYLRQNL